MSARENAPPHTAPWMETGQLADVSPVAQPHPSASGRHTFAGSSHGSRLRAPAISGHPADKEKRVANSLKPPNEPGSRYEDYGSGSPIVFAGNCTLSTDMWEYQIPYFVGQVTVHRDGLARPRSLGPSVARL